MIPLVKTLATPLIWVLALMVLDLVLTRGLPKKKQYRLGRCAIYLGICILFFLGIRPTAELLTYSLECQYKAPSDEILATLDVVTVLGGGVSPPKGLRTHSELSGIAYSRLINGVRIFKQSNAQVLALSGGGVKPGYESEAEVMKVLAMELGVLENQIITETKSRNTMENSALLAKILPAKQNRRIGLVTSALHMPRSVKVFRRQFPNDTIVPIPVNYLYSPSWSDLRSYIPSPGALGKSDHALHEWIGMVWYAIRY